ncbi:chromate transporter [Streptomyces sp. IMTB 1903]|uniref:chromate transporter n=1 Tax=Streptomyces sp. IMTB 1903 TaxID=1776680 RepID=UPI00075C6E9D|nr:chromate transporter [Streptomyces sp. IMTB 1903]
MVGGLALADRDPGTLAPWARAALLGALLTTWVTFVPCFPFIFLGAPYIERLRGNRRISAALTGITAAAVGVIANLALYFAEHAGLRFATVHTRRRTLEPLPGPGHPPPHGPP